MSVLLLSYYTVGAVGSRGERVSCQVRFQWDFAAGLVRSPRGSSEAVHLIHQ